MQYIPCNSALLAQEALFLPKKALFMPKDLQKKVRKSRQFLIRDKIAYVPPVLPCNLCHPGIMLFLGNLGCFCWDAEPMPYISCISSLSIRISMSLNMSMRSIWIIKEAGGISSGGGGTEPGVLHRISISSSLRVIWGGKWIPRWLFISHKYDCEESLRRKNEVFVIN